MCGGAPKICLVLEQRGDFGQTSHEIISPLCAERGEGWGEVSKTFVRPHARAQPVGDVVRALEQFSCRRRGDESQSDFSFQLSVLK